jgi:hypothetical protein
MGILSECNNCVLSAHIVLEPAFRGAVMGRHAEAGLAALKQFTMGTTSFIIPSIESVFWLATVQFPILGCTEGDVRLLEGSTRLEGRVEICKNSVWSTVCHVGWTSTDARVVCRQLGYSATGMATCI